MKASIIGTGSYLPEKILTNEDLTSFVTEIEALKRELTLLHANAAKDIAEKKLKDLNANTVDQELKIIIDSAKSMRIEVTN